MSAKESQVHQRWGLGMKILHNKVKVENVWDNGQRREYFSSSKKGKRRKVQQGKNGFVMGKDQVRQDRNRQGSIL